MHDLLATTLQQHGSALRRLARALVGADHADDLVQAAAVAALHQGTVPRRPLPFLRHVLRQLAKRHHRGQARQRRRDAVAANARPQQVPPAEHALERREAVARLHEALLAVPEPHLGALLLRWFEDLPPSAIAHRLGVPLPTVKSRLQRGLELLRAELDRRAPRDDWRAGLATAFGLHPSTPAPTIAAVPLLAVALPMKLLLLMSCGGLLLAAALWSLPQSPAPAPATTPAAAGRGAGAPPIDAVAATRTPDARVAVAAGTPPGPPGAWLSGRALTSGQRPLPGARVEVRDDSDEARSTLRAAAAAAADGTFALELPVGRHRVTIVADGHVGLDVHPVPQFAPGERRDLGDVVLEPGMRVHGRVVDRDDRPVANVVVWPGQDQAAAPPGFDFALDIVWTDDDGRFVLPPLPPMDTRFEVADEQLIAPAVLRYESGRRDYHVELRVESAARQATLRGIVVDDAGRPLAGAIVTATERHAGRRHAFEAVTGADGTFQLRRLLPTPPQPVEVHAQAGTADDAAATDVAWGRSDLRLVLRPLGSLTISVTDADAVPVPEVRLDLHRVVGPFAVPGRFEAHVPDGRSRTQDGRITIAGLRAGPYDVQVHDPDGAFLASRVQRVLVQGDTHTTAVLPARAERTVQVRFADGRPVVGTGLELCEAVDRAVDLDSIAVAGDDWSATPFARQVLRRDGGTTDERGERTLVGPAGSPLALRVLGPGCLPLVLALPRLEGDGPLVVQVGAGGALRVRATPAALLAELAGLPGAVNLPPPPAFWLTRQVGDRAERVPPANTEPGRFDAAGELLLRAIPPGTWTPVVQYGLVQHTLPPVGIVDGDTADAHVDLTPYRPFELRGRVLVDGVPAMRQAIVLERRTEMRSGAPERWAPVASGATDSDGAFLLRGVPGSCRLLLRELAPADGPRPRLLATPAPLLLAPGDRVERTFVVTLGPLQLRVVDRQGRPVAGAAGLVVRRADHDELATLAPTDAEGRTGLGRAEAGTFQLVAFPRRLGSREAALVAIRAAQPGDPDAPERALLDLGQVVVTAGASGEQTIVLPDAWFR